MDTRVLICFFIIVICGKADSQREKRGFGTAPRPAPELLLWCHVGVIDKEVKAITIVNATSGHKLAWLTEGNAPTLAGNGTGMFLSGTMPKDHSHPARLEILILHHEIHAQQKFRCQVKKILHDSEIDEENWDLTVNKTDTTTTTTAAPSTEKPRVGAAKAAVTATEPDKQSMTVLIIILVLISVLLFIAVVILLHNYRSRCTRREETMYHPPAYCLAPDHQFDWGTGLGTLKKGSARTIDRSHYSMAAQPFMQMPLPPLPSSTVPRRIYRRTPSFGGSISSVRVPYIQPQDAIGQETMADDVFAAPGEIPTRSEEISRMTGNINALNGNITALNNELSALTGDITTQSVNMTQSGEGGFTNLYPTSPPASPLYSVVPIKLFESVMTPTPSQPSKEQ